MIPLPFISLFAMAVGGGSDKTILQRIAAGDPKAVQECMDTYGGLLWSLARKKGLDPEDADDIVQDIFIELWRRRGLMRVKEALDDSDKEALQLQSRQLRSAEETGR